MKKKLLLILSTVAIILSSCTGKKVEQREALKIPSDWAKIEESDYMMRYPRDWELQQNVAGTRFCVLSMPSSANDVFRENVNLVIENLLEEISIDKYAVQITKGLEGKYKVSEKKKYVTGKVEYYSLKYDAGNDLTEQYVFIKDKHAYILTFTAEKKESEAVKKVGETIMRSFMLK